MNLLDVGLFALALWTLFYTVRAYRAACFFRELQATRHVRENLVLLQAVAIAPRIAARVIVRVA